MLSSGYWIGGFGLEDSMDEHPALLNAIVVSMTFYIGKCCISHDYGDKFLQKTEAFVIPMILVISSCKT